MYNETTYLKYTNRSGQQVTFAGFTKKDFKARYLNGLPDAKLEYMKRHSVPKIADLGDFHVQLALIGAFCVARDAAVQVDGFFKRASSKDKFYRDVCRQFFRLKNPSKKEHGVIQETFDKTRRGLEGAVVICDMFKGADHEPGGPSWGASEGEVLIPTNVLREYSANAGKKDEAGDIMRKMLEREAVSVQNIHLRFNLVHEMTVDGLARVIFHEATHKYAYTGDYKYIYDSTSMKGVKSKQALYNADSYAFAGMSVHLRRVVTKSDLVGSSACDEPLHDAGWLDERMQ
jgi:hypothetical protein